MLTASIQKLLGWLWVFIRKLIGITVAIAMSVAVMLGATGAGNAQERVNSSALSANVWLDAPDDPMIRRLFEFSGHAWAAPIGDHYRYVPLDTRFIRRTAEEASAASAGPAATEDEAPTIRF